MIEQVIGDLRICGARSMRIGWDGEEYHESGLHAL